MIELGGLQPALLNFNQDKLIVLGFEIVITS